MDSNHRCTGCRPVALAARLCGQNWLREQESNLHALRRRINSPLGYHYPTSEYWCRNRVSSRIFRSSGGRFHQLSYCGKSGAGGESRSLYTSLEDWGVTINTSPAWSRRQFVKLNPPARRRDYFILHRVNLELVDSNALSSHPYQGRILLLNHTSLEPIQRI